jgi:hypothetical protein
VAAYAFDDQAVDEDGVGTDVEIIDSQLCECGAWVAAL